MTEDALEVLKRNRRFAGRWNTNNGFRGSAATDNWHFGSGDVKCLRLW
jgi:hypothetical protein